MCQCYYSSAQVNCITSKDFIWQRDSIATSYFSKSKREHWTFSWLSYFYCLLISTVEYFAPHSTSVVKNDQTRSTFSIIVKPWPNGLASQPNFPFRLAAHLRWLWSSSNSYASRRTFFTVSSPNTSWSQVICICVKFTACVNLRNDLRIRLAALRKSVRKFWFIQLASTCESVSPGL